MKSLAPASLRLPGRILGRPATDACALTRLSTRPPSACCACTRRGGAGGRALCALSACGRRSEPCAKTLGRGRHPDLSRATTYLCCFRPRGEPIEQSERARTGNTRGRLASALDTVSRQREARPPVTSSLQNVPPRRSRASSANWAALTSSAPAPGLEAASRLPPATWRTRAGSSPAQSLESTLSLARAAPTGGHNGTASEKETEQEDVLHAPEYVRRKGPPVTIFQSGATAENRDKPDIRELKSDEGRDRRESAG